MMAQIKKETIKAITGIIVVISLFIIISFITQYYAEYFQSSLSNNIPSMVIYVLLLILEIILAPISVFPFIPIASAIWGSQNTFFLTLFGWTIGSIIAFLIARKIGVPLVERIVSSKDLDRVQAFIPEKNLFIGVIIIRVILPFDLISYAIGLFTHMTLRSYALATLIGFIPGTLFLAYFGDIPNEIKILLLLIGLFFILSFILIHLMYGPKFFDKIVKSWEKAFKN